MFEYMTAQEAAEKWEVSLRWVQRLCKDNRVDGVINVTVYGLFQKRLKSLLMRDLRMEFNKYEKHFDYR